MSPSSAPKTRMARLTSRQAAATVLGVAAAIISLSVLTRAVNHDESQYVASIALMRLGLPYRDFAYLQTPLQPLLLSPLSLLPAGWVWIAARMVNGLLGFTTLLLLLVALRGRVSARAALIAVAALLGSDAFLLASSLARNDALAMASIAAAIPALLAAAETSSPKMFLIGGIFLGLASSTKLNAALPAAGAGLFILFGTRQFGFKALMGFSLGLLVGLIPTIALAATAPSQFFFDVMRYNIEAPAQWWTYLGEGAELHPARRLLKLIGLASLGSSLVALIAAAVDRERSDGRSMLNYMIVGGLVAAYLPAPALTQYLVPLLPPLFARFGLALDAGTPKRKKTLAVLAALACVAGLANSFFVRFTRAEILRSITLGHEVAALAQRGLVVTLSAQYVAGQGVSLDPRFAAGPFLYRTRGALARSAQAQGRATTVDSLAPELDRKAPAVILTGGEARDGAPDYPNGLDQTLISWARGRRYRAVPLGGGFIAFMNPAADRAGAGPPKLPAER